MYTCLMANPSAAAASASPAPTRPGLAGALQSPSLAGNWLAVYGNIIIGTNSALLQQVRHVSTIAAIPPLAAGPYSLELYNAGNSLLANYPFTPLPATDDHPNWLAFSQVGNSMANTIQLRN